MKEKSKRAVWDERFELSLVAPPQQTPKDDGRPNSRGTPEKSDSSYIMKARGVFVTVVTVVIVVVVRVVVIASLSSVMTRVSVGVLSTTTSFLFSCQESSKFGCVFDGDSCSITRHT